MIRFTRYGIGDSVFISAEHVIRLLGGANSTHIKLVDSTDITVTETLDKVAAAINKVRYP
jgi:hypothetical protein